MLFTDEHPEEHEDDSTCIQGNFKKINSTTFKQMWYITSSQHGYGAIIMDLPTIITHSGDWVVTDPLGGNKLAEAILLHFVVVVLRWKHTKKLYRKHNRMHSLKMKQYCYKSHTFHKVYIHFCKQLRMLEESLVEFL